MKVTARTLIVESIRLLLYTIQHSIRIFPLYGRFTVAVGPCDACCTSQPYDTALLYQAQDHGFCVHICDLVLRPAHVFICRKPTKLAQQLFVNHLARPLTCVAHEYMPTGHAVIWEVNREGRVNPMLTMKTANGAQSRQGFGDIRPFDEPAVRIP